MKFSYYTPLQKLKFGSTAPTFQTTNVQKLMKEFSNFYRFDLFQRCQNLCILSILPEFFDFVKQTKVCASNSTQSTFVLKCFSFLPKI